MNKIGTTNKLQELAPLLWLQLQGYNPENKVKYQKYAETIFEKSSLLGIAATYFGLNQLHDCHFIDIKEKDKDVVFVLKDWVVSDFAWSLVEYKQLPVVYDRYDYSFELVLKMFRILHIIQLMVVATLIKLKKLCPKIIYMTSF